MAHGHDDQPNEVAPGAQLDRDDLWRLYGQALDEYRFQVDLNAGRVSQLFTLNAAIIAASVALRGVADVRTHHVAMMFLIGMSSSLVGWMAVDTLHAYYTNTRHRLKGLEADLGIADRGLSTTAGMGGVTPRRIKVTSANRALLMLMAIVNLAGLLSAGSDACRTEGGLLEQRHAVCSDVGQWTMALIATAGVSAVVMLVNGGIRPNLAQAWNAARGMVTSESAASPPDTDNARDST